MEKASSSGQTASSTRVSSKITSATVTESCTILAERSLRASGRMERKTVDVFTLGLMDPVTTSFILTARNKEREF